MYEGKLVFAQLMDFLPLHTFRRCVSRYRGQYKVKRFSCYDQYLCMAFAQLAHRESVRDIETCLRAQHSKLYHMGLRSQVSRNTLANANSRRDWRIYADFAQALIRIARPLYVDDDFGLELQHTVYALDSSTIDLCLSVFPWARFKQGKAAVKLHTLLTCAALFPALSTSPTANYTTSIFSTCSAPNRAPSTSSTGPTSISNDSSDSNKPVPSLSPDSVKTSNSLAATLTPSTRRQDCAVTKPLSSPAPSLHSTIHSHYDA